MRWMRWLSPAGSAARLQVFIFHRVLPEPDALLSDEPDAARFEAQLGWIARHFDVLPLADAARRLRAGDLPAAPACITFDDGYADNRTVAAPILQRHGMSATFFIASGYIDGGRMWNDSVIEAVRRAPAGVLDWQDLGLGRHAVGNAGSRIAAYGAVLGALKHQPPAVRSERVAEIVRRAGLPERSGLMMTRQQVAELREMGMQIGGHTVRHPILHLLDDAGALAEIADNRQQLTTWVGEAPAVFAFPNGVPGQDYSARDVDLVRRCGYEAAVSTSPGAARHGADPFQIPRFTPWDRTPTRFAARCAWNLARVQPRYAA